MEGGMLQCRSITLRVPGSHVSVEEVMDLTWTSLTWKPRSHTGRDDAQHSEALCPRRYVGE